MKDGEIIAAQSNTVTLDNDPTAHAEVNAIRTACQALGTFDLDGCVIYTSCEPCPMCFGTIYWAGIDRIYYANTRKDAANIGFADDHIYRELARPKSVRDISETQLLRDEALAAFQAWSENPARTEY